ncbi:iron-containing alcohol dehydrogenase [uncultured Ruminococcus sp.]|uniref:iron-containing alcohol dehydrogenase n=1 Tax=uncultured Ruminococcus sp. TaxID=165186 RepID=UPI0025990B9B|nr:iron-containing alcohol dehydrogenase [uncultured Ruminococcus sp.]
MNAAAPVFVLGSSAQSLWDAANGVDALTHAIESYTSRKRQPLTDTVALAAVKRIFRYLPTAYSNGSDLTARSEMAIAALEAGMAINNASVTLVHGMSRPIGALFHVPHGISNAMLLEKSLDFALEGDYPGFAALARAIGAADTATPDPQAAEALIGAVRELCKVCQVPTLEEYGFDRTAFFSAMDKMAEDAIASGSPANTMKPVTKADVIRIYRGLWEK